MHSQTMLEFKALFQEIETPALQPKGAELLRREHDAGACLSDMHRQAQ